MKLTVMIVARKFKFLFSYVCQLMCHLFDEVNIHCALISRSLDSYKKTKVNDMKQAGFTLIEVMITVAIIGILAAIALPSYGRYVARSKVADAIGNLSNAKSGMEQFYQDNGTYLLGTNCGAGTPASVDGFNFTCTATATTYNVTMTGTGSVAAYQYSIDNFGAKATVASPFGTSNTCWLISSTNC